MNETPQQLEDELQVLGKLVEGILIEAAEILRDGDLDAMERFEGEVRKVHRKQPDHFPPHPHLDSQAHPNKHPHNTLPGPQPVTHPDR